MLHPVFTVFGRKKQMVILYRTNNERAFIDIYLHRLTAYKRKFLGKGARGRPLFVKEGSPSQKLFAKNYLLLPAARAS